MPLTVFDAVGKFSADTSQLDQFITKLERGLSSASEKAAASTQALKEAQNEFRASIQAVSAAGGDTTDNLERLAQAERNLALASAAAKSEHAALKQELVGTKEASSLATQATAELGGKLASMFGIIAAAEGLKSLIVGTQQSILELELLSQKTGIAIDTLAGIEHEAKATGISFEQVGTALTRLSRSQALAIEGGKAQIQAFERIGISVNDLKSLSPEELFYRIAGAMADSKSHAETNASAFALLGRGGAALIPIFNEGTDALRKNVEAAAKASGVTKEAGLAALDWERQTANLSEAFRSGLIPLMEAAVPVIKSVETAGAGVAMSIGDIFTVLGGLFFAVVAQIKGMGTIVDDVIHGNFSKLVSDSKNMDDDISGNLNSIGENLKSNWQGTADYIKEVWKDAKPFGAAADDLSDLVSRSKNNTKDLTAELKAQLDQQLANIEKWKADMHAAFAAGKIDAEQWAEAQRQAAYSADIAHEDYLQRLIAVYLKAKEAGKAHAAQLELTAEETKDAAKQTDRLATAEEKRQKEIKKALEEAQKAVQGLTAAEDKLAQAQTKLSEDKLAQHYKDQELAITKLAQMHLITEEQKDNRLKLLENQQANDAIAILNSQLKREQDEVVAAQAKLASLKIGIGISPAQVIEAETNLKKLETRVVETEDKIVQTQEKFNKQSEQNDKSHYGRALLLFMSYGNNLLAEQLKQNHADLLATEQELALVKARGQDTTAIEKKIAALKQHDKELEKEASGNKQIIAQQLQLTKVQLLAAQAVLADAKARGQDTTVIEKQIADLKKLQSELTRTVNGTKNLALATDKLKQEMKAAASEMLSDLSTAFEGIITGQQSFGKAMEEATFKLIGNMAKSWAEYFAAKGIADIWDDPGLGAAELAAAAALFAVSGIMSGLGSNAGSSGGGSSVPNRNANGLNPQQASSSGGGSHQIVVVPLMATSGSMLSPSTMAAAGSAIAQAPSGGASIAAAGGDLDARMEAIASNAFSRSAAASAGGDTHIHVKGLISPDNLKKVIQQQNRMVKNRQVNLRASDSLRVTRRSQ